MKKLMRMAIAVMMAAALLLSMAYAEEIATPTDSAPVEEVPAVAEPAPEVTEEVAEEAAEEVAEEVTEEVTDEATEEVAEEVAEEVTDEAIEEVTEEVAEEESAADVVVVVPEEQEIDLSLLSVKIRSNQGAVLMPGQVVTLTAELTGFEDIEVALQWQAFDGETWQDIEGATGMTFDYEVTPATVNCLWHLVVTIL